MTAHFIVNNGDDDAYNVSLYVVQNLSESDRRFPLKVTLRDGSTRTNDRDVPPFIPGPLRAKAIRIEPVSGTLVAVHQRLPPRSTLRLDVTNIPADAMSMDVICRIGAPERPMRGFGRYGGICTRASAYVDMFNASHSSIIGCGDISDGLFPDSLINRSVAASNASESS